MSANSNIEWTDHTFNPWIGCTKISPACDHCYAERRDHRLHGGQHWGPGAKRHRTGKGNWAQPRKWNREAFVECLGCGWRGPSHAAESRDNVAGFHPPIDSALICPSCDEPLLKESRARVFCASLADVFDKEVPVEWRADLLDVIRQTPELDWLLLTKRIGAARDRLDEAAAYAGENSDLFDWLGLWLDGEELPHNVWLGATVVNQEEADRDIPKLLETPAAVRFLSCEPLLGSIDLQMFSCEGDRVGMNRFEPGCLSALSGEWWPAVGDATYEEATRETDLPSLDWVIAGGESGPQARPSHPDWFRSLRDQCQAAAVPYFFKQWGEWAPEDAIPERDALDPDRGLLHVRYGEFHGNGDWVESCACSGGDAGSSLYRVGKKAAGRQLDGRTWDQMPS